MASPLDKVFGLRSDTIMSDPGVDRAFGLQGGPQKLEEAEKLTASIKDQIRAQLKQLKRTNPTMAKAVKKVPVGKLEEMAAAIASKTVPAAEAVAETAVKAGKGIGRIAGPLGLGAGFLMPLFSASPVTLAGRHGKAREMAVKGFAALGASSSSEALSAIVNQQETAARRQIVMQTYEPDMFNQVLNILANTGAAPSSITSSERQIGSNVEKAMPSRRPDKDIHFLLDQLLKEASG